VFERHACADVQFAVAGLDLLQLGDVAEVDDVTQVAELLRDPQPDVGRAREQPRCRVRQPQGAARSASEVGAWK
jgi:hypothetical protein